MKLRKVFSICLLTLICGVIPEYVSAKALGYQAAVTDNEGAPLLSTDVNFNIRLHQNSADGEVVYAETISTTTSPSGIAYFNIGENGGQTSIEDLDWGGTTYFLEIDYSHSGGSKSLGSTMVMSVPRAMHADSASSLMLSSPSGKKFKVVIDDNGNVSATPIAE